MGAILLIAKKRMVSIAVNYLGYALQRKLLLTIILDCCALYKDIYSI